MNVQQEKQQKGFTIIEVILVLAIAALIFLMVFIALPALQRGQRDTARKQDVGDVASAVTNYTGNNQGNFPTSGTAIMSYAKVSSNTTKISVGTKGASTASVKSGEMMITQATTCKQSNPVASGTATEDLAAGSTSSFTVVTYLEAGGGTSFCQDS